MAFEVFVSHSMEVSDAPLLQQAVALGKLSGLTTYMAENDRQPGVYLSDKIQKAIDRTDCFIAFWTKHGSKSEYVNQEIGYAAHAKKTRILVVEKGLPVKGFEVGKEYIEYDPEKPKLAMIGLVTHLVEQRISKEKENNANAVLALAAILLLVLFCD